MSSTSSLPCRIAVGAPKPAQLLTYLLPKHLEDLPLGSIVEVPLGKKSVRKGVLWSKGDALTEEEKSFDLKEVLSVFEAPLKFSEKEMAFFKWVGDYYHYYFGAFIFDALPSKWPSKTSKLLVEQGMGQPLSFSLTQDQNQLIGGLSQKLFCGFSRHLIHGVTGSGKSAIYLSLAQKILDAGKSLLFLVPEINLTPQLLAFFSKHLTAPIYPYHSGLTPVQKSSLWDFLSHDESPKVVLGARSSLFLPLKKKGLIIVDEEHDSSYKQDSYCPYHARDVALKLAQWENIPIIMGSATPSLEAFYYHARPEEKAPVNYWPLHERAVSGSLLPHIHLVESNPQQIDKKDWPLSPLLWETISKSLEQGEQVLIFVNRLGFAHYVWCPGCGHRFRCRHCDSKLRYFKHRNTLECQLCQYKTPLPQNCPKCFCLTLVQEGFGTERLLNIFKERLPNFRHARFDRDELTTFKQLSECLDDFKNQKIDLLIGTQMLSKGHNFEKVNLVVVLGIDEQLSVPDFRALEKSYQLLTQISGRAGRFGKEGHVYIQTSTPHEELFTFIQSPDMRSFYEQELPDRQFWSYPPYSYLAAITFTGKNKESVKKTSEHLALSLREVLSEDNEKIIILGPGPTLIEKRKNSFTWKILLKSKDRPLLHRLLSGVEHFEGPYDVILNIDVDPYDFL